MTHTKKAVPVGLMIDERIQTASRPRLSGKVLTDRLTKGASMSRDEKRGSCKTTVNTCLSFLNEVKNLAKNTGVKYAFCD